MTRAALLYWLPIKRARGIDMARDPGTEAIYKVAEQFRDRCLKRGHSLLWPDDPVWTVENLVTLREAFMNNLDKSDRTFFEKLREQIANCDKNVHKVAADVVALYFVPIWYKAAGHTAKSRSVKDVISWKLTKESPNLDLLEEAFAEEGLLDPGVWYMTARPWLITYYLRFAEEMLGQGVNPEDMQACKQLADHVLTLIPKNASASREIILHLLFPEQFEDILTNDKKAIAEAFKRYAGGASDVDDALFNIRQELERQKGRPISFYQDEDIWNEWHKDGGDELLEGIADLLDNRKLDDPDILSLEGFRSNIFPVTRSFLEQAAAAVALGKGDYAAGRKASRKRGCFDKWDVAFEGIRLFVVVGFADDKGELERKLVWGASGWGPTAAADSTEQKLQAMRAPDFTLRKISTVDSVGFGGTEVVLYKSLSTDELRAADASSLIEEISADLQMLRAQLPANGEHDECEPFLVGADETAGNAAERILARIANGQPAAMWWSYPVVDERKTIADVCPYLYVYAAQPVSKITHRLHFREYESKPGNDGMVSPWRDYTLEEERDRTSLGPTKNLICKTWFLVDRVDTLDPPLAIEDLERLDGVQPKPADLLGGFGIWRRKGSTRRDSRSNLRDLANAANMDEAAVREIVDLVSEKRQLILEGPPGSGKTFVAQLLGRHLTDNPLNGATVNDRLTIVQFHQSYGYEDFIEGIRPDTQKGQMTYSLVDGTFKEACRKALKADRNEPFVIIIDEINRGNISRIFGELLLSLEYRKEGFSVTLPYSKEPFTIPENVHIVATMNTTDRSLALIDYALRRRFYFYRLMPVGRGRAPVLERWLAKSSMPAARRAEILRLFIALNEKVQAELDEHHQVGHSYFMTGGASTPEGLRRIWTRGILPLLEEYFYNRPKRAEILDGFSLERLLAVPEPLLTSAPVEPAPDA